MVIMQTRRRGKERGAASVEAVVILPVMILVFAGVLFVTHVYEAKQRTLLEARMQAWEQSENACKGAAVLPNDAARQRERLRKEQTGVSGGGSAEGERTATAINGILGGPLDELFGASVTTEAGREVKGPPPFDRRVARVGSSYHLVCNIEPKSLSDLALSLFKAVF
jgi:hypothetical protein